MIAVSNSSSQNGFIREILVRLISALQTTANEISKSLYAVESFVTSSHKTFVNPRTDHQILKTLKLWTLKMWDIDQGIWKLYLMHFLVVAGVITAALFPSRPHWWLQLFTSPVHVSAVITGDQDTEKGVNSHRDIFNQILAVWLYSLLFCNLDENTRLQSCHYQKRKT